MKKKPKLPPKITVFLDDEEKELIESIEQAYERGEIRPLTGARKQKALKDAVTRARNTLAKDARVNLRMTRNDLLGLKAKAAEEGMPYQTLLSCLVHKYVSGQVKFSPLA